MLVAVFKWNRRRFPLPVYSCGYDKTDEESVCWPLATHCCSIRTGVTTGNRAGSILLSINGWTKSRIIEHGVLTELERISKLVTWVQQYPVPLARAMQWEKGSLGEVSQGTAVVGHEECAAATRNKQEDRRKTGESHQEWGANLANCCVVVCGTFMPPLQL